MTEDKIDEKIMGLVSALNRHGIPTTGSCEGHIDHDSPSPWVKISAEDGHILQRSKELLDEFYDSRNVPQDVRFVIRKGNSGFWIHNGGEAYDRWRDFVDECVVKIKNGEKIGDFFSAEEMGRRSKDLPRYQKEAELFAKFIEKTMEQKSHRL